ncbi:hypothetical protein IE981_15025 [Klebsiella pneumoniae]|nr:hypothetical protein [Klebsiella pneumoniae]
MILFGTNVLCLARHVGCFPPKRRVERPCLAARACTGAKQGWPTATSGTFRCVLPLPSSGGVLGASANRLHRRLRYGRTESSWSIHWLQP